LGVSVAGIAPLVRIQFFPDDYNTYYAFIEGPSAMLGKSTTIYRVSE
jgi:HAE1 family hydrophobic/amphiphilic exporter-1